MARSTSEPKNQARSAGEATAPGGNAQAWARNVLQHVLTVTCWLDPGQTGPGTPSSAELSPATIGFSGRRVGVTGEPRPGDSFWREETVGGVVPGSGPVAVTTQIRGISPGWWTVTARPITGGHAVTGVCQPPSDRGARMYRGGGLLLRLAGRTGSGPAITTTPPLSARVPGTIRFAWAMLVLAGVLAGLGIEAVLLRRDGFLITTPLGISVLAVAAGLVGGKGWYIVQHRGRRSGGWSIAGGLVLGTGVALAALLAARVGADLGIYLNLAAPGVLLGLAIGRPGCLLAGCCAGRPTGSRWGIWSSDGRLGIRRIPVQLLESLVALLTGLTALTAVVVPDARARSGAVFAGALATYTLGRQFLLPLRAAPRRTRFGRPVTIAVAVLVLIADVILAAAG